MRKIPKEITRARALLEMARLLAEISSRDLELLLEEMVANAGTAAGPDLYGARLTVVPDDTSHQRVLK